MQKLSGNFLADDPFLSKDSTAVPPNPKPYRIWGFIKSLVCVGSRAYGLTKLRALLDLLVLSREYGNTLYKQDYIGMIFYPHVPY